MVCVSSNKASQCHCQALSGTCWAIIWNLRLAEWISVGVVVEDDVGWP